MREVKYETLKVSWPSKKETTSSVVMVFLMVLFFSLFFLLTDTLVVNAIDLVVGI
ncbi:MAG: preprotein translocase subunit SecE [Pseudomonadota bacterium]